MLEKLERLLGICRNFIKIAADYMLNTKQMGRLASISSHPATTRLTQTICMLSGLAYDAKYRKDGAY